MKKNVKTISVILVVSMILSLFSMSLVFAEEVTQEEETVAADIKIIGTENEEAESIKIINSTGSDINFISIYEEDDYDPNAEIVAMQEALIEQGYLDDVADGSVGPKTTAAISAFREANGMSEDGGVDDELLAALIKDYDDGNLLDEEDVFEKDTTEMLYYVIEDAEENDSEADDSEAVENPSYIMVIHLADSDAAEGYDEYIIHSIPVDDTDEITVIVSDGIAYITYVSKATGEEVSTLDAEKALVAADTQTYDNYDDGYYDDGYYDDGYYDDGYYDDASYDDSYYYDDTSYDDGAQGADGCIEDGLFY